MLRHLIAILLSSALVGPLAKAAEAPPALVSGQYDQMLIASDPRTGRVTGYLNATRGEGVTFSCIFFVDGKLDGSQANIVSYFPPEPKEKILGAIVLGSEDVRLDLEEMPGGCGMEGSLGPQTEKEGASTHLSLLALHQDWKEIRVVQAKKQYLSKTADVHTRQKAYLVQGDGVAVIGGYEEWRHVEYLTANGKPVSGWLPEKSLYPLARQ